MTAEVPFDRGVNPAVTPAPSGLKPVTDVAGPPLGSRVGDPNGGRICAQGARGLTPWSTCRGWPGRFASAQPRREYSPADKPKGYNVTIKRHLGKLALASAAAAGMVAIPLSAASAQTTGPINGHATFFTTAEAGSGPGPIIFTGSVLHALCVDNQGDSIDNIDCPGGSFQINHSVTAPAEVDNFNFNPNTCVGTFTFTGAAFSFQSGTGHYAGLSGGGTANGLDVSVQPRNPDGTCNTSDNAQPVAGFETIQASFQASLPRR
jgi:hypothetical protein